MTETLLFGAFACTLLAIARFHAQATRIAVAGMLVVALLRLSLTDFDLGAHLLHEAHIVTNLAGLLLGFAVLAAHFEHSHLPEKLTEVLPTGRKGAFLLLLLVFVLSAMLDNIAAALIGGSAAITLFRRRLHIGYLAAIVAASNAGGAGSVVGDTTTTMMWIAGASPLWLVNAGVGAAFAFAFFGVVASRQQHALQPMTRLDHPAPPVDVVRVGIVALILVGTVYTNVKYDFPAAGVWAAILLGWPLRRVELKLVAEAGKGAAFLLCLVLAASMMPVSSLPDPTVATTFALGFVSSVFDNIPLTKLAIDQGGYDWGLLAFAVGYGGSMLWFGSSAGVAISGVFPEAKSAKQWLLAGWHVPVGYVIGFAAMAALLGFTPRALPKHAPTVAPAPARAPADGG